MINFTLCYHMSGRKYHTWNHQAKYKGHTLAREVKVPVNGSEPIESYRIMGTKNEFDTLQELLSFVDKVETFDGGGRG